MPKISAFADEISDDLTTQLDVLQAARVGYIELRGVWGKNVMALTDDEVREVRARAAERGIGFSAVGSPLGKYPIDADLQPQVDGVRRALEIAQLLGAPYIRMFSFWMPPGEDPAAYRQQVIDHLGAMLRAAEGSRVTLAHENEKGIYGDTGARCLDLYEALSGAGLAAAFDFANFVQCDQRPYADCWPQLRPYVRYFHIKDALLGSGQVVPAGQGDGDVARILREAFAAGFDDFLTLEPHLSLAEASYGRTTPDLFHTAAAALHAILEDVSPG